MGVMELRLSWLGSDDEADFGFTGWRGAGNGEVRIKGAKLGDQSVILPEWERKLLNLLRGRESRGANFFLGFGLLPQLRRNSAKGCDDGKRLRSRGGLGEGDDDSRLAGGWTRRGSRSGSDLGKLLLGRWIGTLRRPGPSRFQPLIRARDLCLLLDILGAAR